VRADVNIVETVAHMMSAVKFFGDVDVICDIGGQDIKVLFMKNGDIANFKLSNSCSAGNGMLLQAMADQFGSRSPSTPTRPSRPSSRRSSATAARSSSTPTG
jgi:activator of 2-hydroxyglutaryl-CoA dehydratase